MTDMIKEHFKGFIKSSRNVNNHRRFPAREVAKLKLIYSHKRG